MKDYTDLNIIVDRSGSMSSIAEDMVGGLRTFVETEKTRRDDLTNKVKDVKVSYYIFDDKYEEVFSEKDIQNVKPEDFKLVPRGWTALIDAIGKTITSVGERLSNLAENDRPNRVLFMIVTDGADNRSSEYKLSKVKDMIKHQRDVYAWDFAFLGANIDTFGTANSLSIGAASTCDWQPTKRGVNDAFRGFTESYASYACLDRSQDRGSTFAFKNAATPPSMRGEKSDVIVPPSENP